jgi:two-component system CheB/CheR fusion protein
MGLPDFGQQGDSVHSRHREVADDGIGIEPVDLPRVFEPFVQLEAGLARADGGLGIGLALVRQLARLHGGAITACSEGAGRGAAFMLRLPRGGPAKGGGSDAG